MILSTTPSNIVSIQNVVDSDPVRISLPKTLVGPTVITNALESVYQLSEYKYLTDGVEVTNPSGDALNQFNADKESISWIMWVDGGQMDGDHEYIIIRNKALIPDQEEDFTDESAQERFIEAVDNFGYTLATMEIVEINGDMVNRLTIIFSKWLDQRSVNIEPYRNYPDHNLDYDYVMSTYVEARPQITKAYWMSDLQSKITATNFDTSIFLCVETLGLINNTLSVQLFDSDSGFSDDDALLWNGGSSYHFLLVNQRKIVIPYNVEASDSVAYENAHGDEFDDDIEVYVKFSSDEPLLSLTVEDEYARIVFTPDIRLNLFFAERKEITVGDITVYQYERVSEILPGISLYIVAETTNFDESITFSVYEEETLLVDSDNPLPLICNGESQTEIIATIDGEHAVAEVTFQELNSDNYNAWNDLLLPDNGNINESELIIKVITSDETEYVSTLNSKLIAPIIIQLIYPDGTISKENYVENLIRYVKFLYHTSLIEDDDTVYDLGIFDLNWAQRWTDGFYSQPQGTNWQLVHIGSKRRWYTFDGVLGERSAPLVRLTTTQFSDFNGNTKFKFEHFHNENLIIRLTEDTNREYFNPERISAIIGAIIDCGYIDITTNGSVGMNGHGHPSITHINGNNIDFKYLRLDGLIPEVDLAGGVVHTTFDTIDVPRQNQFLESLHKFGYARSELCYSHFLSDGSVLNHCVKLDEHHHHLHVQGFVPQFRY